MCSWGWGGTERDHAPWSEGLIPEMMVSHPVASKQGVAVGFVLGSCKLLLYILNVGKIGQFLPSCSPRSEGRQVLLFAGAGLQ